MALESLQKNLVDGQLSEHPDVIRIAGAYTIDTNRVKRRVLALLDERDDKSKGSAPIDVASAIREVEQHILATYKQAIEDIPPAGGSIHGGTGGRPGRVRGWTE